MLRIEDTDAARNRPEWTEGIISALDWIGIDGDDPASRAPTSSRPTQPQHRDAAAELLRRRQGVLLRLHPRGRSQARTGTEHQGYDGFCRDRGLGPARARAALPHPRRGRRPSSTTWSAASRRSTTTRIEDFVIARGDGSPVFLLANVVDDIDDGHHPRDPRRGAPAQHAQAAAAVGGARARTPPVWAHVPVVVNEKRQEAVQAARQGGAGGSTATRATSPRRCATT